MNPALLARQPWAGVPVAGLVGLYDLVQRGDVQIAYDRSRLGNHGELGATAQAEGNDPAWQPQGLRFDAAAATLVRLPPVLDPRTDMTIILAWTITTLDNGVNHQWPLGLGDPGNNAAFAGFYLPRGAGATSFYSTTTGGAKVASLGTPQLGPTIWVARRAGDLNSALDVRTGGAGTISAPGVNIAPHRLTLGALGRTSGYSGYVTASVHSLLLYNRALSDDELRQATRVIARRNAPRGVQLPVLQ